MKRLGSAGGLLLLAVVVGAESESRQVDAAKGVRPPPSHFTGSVSELRRTSAVASEGRGLAPFGSVRLETFTYKEAGGLALQLDVRRPADDAVRPVAVWLHGGGLINGSRDGTGPAQDALLAAGFCVVSVDYRLAPETKLPAIVADVEDAIHWIRRHGRERLRVDPDRLVVTGRSAGGYLALLTGFRVEPRPRAIVAFWGYGEIVGPWVTAPSPHARHRELTLTPEEMAALEAGPPVASGDARRLSGKAYSQTCRRLGVWTAKVSGLDPERDRERLLPYMTAFNVTASYPPTLLIHGTEDTDVPFAQAARLAEEFGRHGVPHELVRVEGAEHGLEGAAPAVVEAAYAAVVPFVRRHLGGEAAGSVVTAESR